MTTGTPSSSSPVRATEVTACARDLRTPVVTDSPPFLLASMLASFGSPDAYAQLLARLVRLLPGDLDKVVEAEPVDDPVPKALDRVHVLAFDPDRLVARQRALDQHGLSGLRRSRHGERPSWALVQVPRQLLLEMPLVARVVRDFR